MNYVIKNEYYTATVSEVGAELISLVAADGKEIMWQSPSESFWSKHAPLLFPICGQLKNKRYTYKGVSYDMKGHGFIGGETFELVEKGESYVVLFSAANEKTLEKYPFSYAFVAKYSLEGDKVCCSVRIENRGGEAMPYMFGWHPGFALPTECGAEIEDYAIDFGGAESLKLVPLQNGPFASSTRRDFALDGGKYTLCEDEIYANDTLIFENAPTRVALTGKKSPYRLELEWSESTPYLCVWKEPSHDARFICLEPWSDTPADGVADENFEVRKMQRLAPGACDSYELSFKYTKE